MSKRILAADDSLTMRQALEYTFAKEPALSLMVVGRGQTVLETLAQESFDLLLLDYRLPDISGLDICVRCKNSPRTAHIPVLLMLGQHTDPGFVSQVGAQGFIRKPFQTSELLERIAEFLHVTVKPLPATLPSATSTPNTPIHKPSHPSIDIEIEVDVVDSVANTANTGITANTAAPPTPFSLLSGAAKGTASSQPPFAFSDPMAHHSSSPSLVPPPLPSTRSSVPSGMTTSVLSPYPAEPKPPVSQPSADMMIDDLPYELNLAGAGGASLRETPAPQPASHALFLPVSDIMSSQAPPTVPFTPDYSREPFVSSTQGTALPHIPPSPFLSAQESTNKLPSVSPSGGSNPSMDASFAVPSYFVSKPLAPPSYTSPPELKKTPTLIPSSVPETTTDAPHPASTDSLEVLVGSPIELRVAAPEQAKELLLPLEDELPARLPTPASLPRNTGPYAPSTAESSDGARSALFTPGNLFEARPNTPRIDHLEQTAVVPAIRRQMGQAPSISPHPGVLSSFDAEKPRHAPVLSTATPMPQPPHPTVVSSCPPQHCQLVFESILPLHAVAMFLQFADYVQNRLQSAIKTEFTSPVVVGVQTSATSTTITLGGSSSVLRCFVPALLEPCGTLQEEERQQIAESFLAGAAEGLRTTLRRSCLQTRISSRPYAMALSQEVPELARISIQKLESCLEEGSVSHYQNTSSRDSRPSEEQSLIPAKLKLRDLLLQHFTIHTMNRLMEEEFSLSIQDMIPLNLSIQSVFLAIIHHFEQRYQLPELAEAIREKQPSFPTRPFEDFPDI